MTDETGMTGPVRLAVWSGPRNISTALMRAWENRPDCVVVDEPLYAYYLDRTGLDHPGREQIIAAGQTDWSAVVAELTGSAAGGAGVYFQKHMTHHLIPGLPRDWLGRLHNVLLIRDPAEVVASYVRSRDAVVAADIGLVQQAELFDQLAASGQTPPVIDAADFLRDPEAYLRWLCDWLGVDFTDAMLSWPAGPRASDGVWARHWYETVRASTGFTPWRARDTHLTGAAATAAEQSRPCYDALAAHRLRL